MVEFRILGPVEVVHGDRLVDIGRRRERALLGILLLEAGTAVPIARLKDLLWDGEPPDTARAAIRVHVSRLRSQLEQLESESTRLDFSGDGYVIRVEPDRVDALRFRGMVEQARGIVPPAERAALLRQALGLWRGPLLADAASDRLRDRLGAPWAESRLAALEAALEGELECGRHHELVGELTALTFEHPDRERFTSMLMLALYRAGRQAAALEAYARHDRLLRTDLGLDPGPELRQLHHRILTADPGLLADRRTPHDLPRAYTAEQTRSHETDTERRATLRRLRDFYLQTAYSAVCHTPTARRSSYSVAVSVSSPSPASVLS